MTQRCKDCPYRKDGHTSKIIRREVIGPIGDPKADICIVGEAPGGTELVKNRPFIGQSGRLLYSALERAGISDPEKECYITNAMSCRPDDSPPSNAAIAACQNRLKTDIELYPRKVVLALGNSALRSVIPNNYKARIGKERGKAVPSGPNKGTVMVATWHPAAVLRNDGLFPQMVKDIKYAVSIAKGAPIRKPGETKYEPWLVTNDEQAKALCRDLLGRPYVGADIETSGLDPRRDYITYLGIAFDRNKVAIVPREFIHHLRRAFRSITTKWVWHNGKFDTSFLHELGIPEARCDEDVMLLHYATCEQRGTHDLKQLSGDILGAEDYEDELKHWLTVENKARKRVATASKRFVDRYVSSMNKFYSDKEVAKRKRAIEREVKRQEKAAIKLWKQLGFVRKNKQPLPDYPLPVQLEPLKSVQREPALDLEEFDRIAAIDHTPATYADVPEEILLPYLAKDCDYTYQLYEHFTAIVSDDPGLSWCYENLLMPASDMLQRVEEHGIYIDRKVVADLEVELSAKQSEARRLVQRLVEPIWLPEVYAKATGAKKVPDHFNVASSQQLKWLLYDKLRLRLPPKEKPNTSKAVLPKLFPPHPIIPAILNYRAASKMLSTYVLGVKTRLDPGGRIHPTYKIHGTETGRLSSSNPNGQNFPSDPHIKDIIAAGEGYVLLETDYSQAELRVLAAQSKDEFLVNVYREGKDLHHEMTVEIFGERFTLSNDAHERERLRRGAKTINFGIAYGMMAPALSRRLGIHMDEAEEMIQAWFRRCPQAQRYLNAVRSMPLKGRYIDTPFGRRRRFPLITDENRHSVQNEAGNFPIQSIASDFTLMSGIRVQPKLVVYDTHIVNIVHDSILAAVPANIVTIEAVAQLIRNEMLATPPDFIGDIVPFDADFKIGRNWGSCIKYRIGDALDLLAA